MPNVLSPLTWNKGGDDPGDNASAHQLVDVAAGHLKVQSLDNLLQVVHQQLHAFIETLESVLEILEFSFKFKLDIILITEEREYAQDEGDQSKETSQSVKKPDKFLVRSFRRDEIEAKEAKEEVGDRLLGHPLVQEDEDAVEDEVGDHETDVHVAEDFLFVRFNLWPVHWVHCVQEETKAAAVDDRLMRQGSNK